MSALHTVLSDWENRLAESNISPYASVFNQLEVNITKHSLIGLRADQLFIKLVVYSHLF